MNNISLAIAAMCKYLLLFDLLIRWINNLLDISPICLHFITNCDVEMSMDMDNKQWPYYHIEMAVSFVNSVLGYCKDLPLLIWTCLFYFPIVNTNHTHISTTTLQYQTFFSWELIRSLIVMSVKHPQTNKQMDTHWSVITISFTFHSITTDYQIVTICIMMLTYLYV